MIVFLNGEFVPEEKAVISVFDRSFLYGDGLFESVRVYNGRPFRWQQHLERLQHGAAFLNIRVPYTTKELSRISEQLLRENAMREAILRLTLSRGIGVRGYSSGGADHPSLVMTLHPAPQIDPDNPTRWRLITASVRVAAGDRLANYKTCNKLPQILARAEAEAQGADEALMLNTAGEVAEAASSNLFWVDASTICTTPLASGILAGVTRGLVIELCEAALIPCRENTITSRTLQAAEGVFLTTSTLEIVSVIAIDGQPVKISPVVEGIRAAYRGAVERETAC
jgi:branched-chain amino acid aminotransferase